MREHDDPELVRPQAFVGQDPIPGDAREMGFDRNTEEGAMLAMAGSLRPAKTSHRVVAWLLLLALLGPFLLGAVRQLF